MKVKTKKWVSIKKALPKIGERIYVKINNVSCYETHYAWKSNFWINAKYRFERYDGKPEPNVTHWQYID